MYIERDLLKMAIEAEVFMTDSTKAAFRSIVRKVPAADVASVVHGEWVPIKRRNIWGEEAVVLECSACKKSDVGQRGITRASDHCPNCGARMDGGKQ